MIDEAIILRRVKARDLAKSWLELSDDIEFNDNDDRQAFWEFIRREAEKHAPPPAVKAVPHVEPMTDQEAARFDSQLIPWGKYCNRGIAQIAVEDPRYLIWLADSDQGFVKQVKRYILNPAVARDLGNLEGDD